MDRLTRQGMTKAVRILLRLKDSSCAFAVAKEPLVNTNTELGQIGLSFMATFAQTESRLNSERVYLAITPILRGERPTKSGKPYGRPKKKNVGKDSNMSLPEKTLA